MLISNLRPEKRKFQREIYRSMIEFNTHLH